MGKKLLSFLIALAFAFSVSTTFAQVSGTKPAEPAKKTAPAKPAEVAKEKVKVITGEVTAVDPVGKTIKVKGKKEELTIGVTEKQIKDIKEGDKVTVKYVEKDGSLVAKSIVKAKKIEKKTEKKTEKETKK
ncbi:MAG: hypothetical protein C0190_04315 [Thermodesulfobacterium geofontis]|uniref:DUF5666 domain-containing protein n=1 Tax=Thermodesulfobacterium geofontis TaxID=1295609 RepID=A0A2N7PND6_9BACT|nr:MAG: hypothetical protein C0190_04315 [Thermodesulfobacterium geofontis]